MTARVAYRSPTGLIVWSLPDTELQVMWPGRGSRLYIGKPMESGGAVTSIQHPTADSSYDTAKDATKAVEAFIAAATA